MALTVTQINSIKKAPLARGTSFAPGGYSLVGEEGPEMRYIPRGSQVYSAPQTRQIFGGNTLSLSVVVQGDATDGTVDKIENVLQNFANNFNDAKRYGYLEPA